MSSLKNRPFIRRRAQLALLTSVCESHEPARLLVESGSRQRAFAIDARFLAHCSKSIVLETSDGVSAATLPAGETIDVHFGHRGRRYAFRSQVSGLEPLPTNGAARMGLHVKCPLALRPGPKRASERVAAPDGIELPVTLVPIWNGSGSICGHMHDLCGGGLGVLVPKGLAETLHPGLICRAMIAVAVRPPGWRFVLRLAHVTAFDDADCVTGWSFVAADDGADLDERHKQLQDWLKTAPHLKAATAYEA